MISDSFDELSELMLKAFFDINPDVATVFGRHDPYDSRLPHGGLKKLQDNLEILESWLSEARAIAASEELSQDQQVSLELLRMSADVQRFAIEDYPLWRMCPDALEMRGTTMLLMTLRDYAPYEERLAGISSQLTELPRYLDQYRSRFDGHRPVKLWTEMAIGTCTHFPEFLKQVERDSAGRVVNSLYVELKRNIVLAGEEIRNHLEWLRQMLQDATEYVPMGREKFAKLMRIRGIVFTPEQMLSLAEKYLAELKAERLSIAKRLSTLGTLEDAYKTARAHCPETFEGVLEATRKEIDKAKCYIIEKDLATIDESAVLRVIETPSFLAPTMSSAALFMPARFDTVQNGIYLETRPSDAEDMRSVWNYGSIINTTVHEAYPGHFLQGVMSNRKPWMHQLPHMLMSPDTMVTSYESQEGWAHYCEKMMHERGYEATDEAALAMIDGGIWRACRVVYDIKLCFGDASLEEMIQMLMMESNVPRGPAEGDVKGFSRTPGYPVSYMIGRHLVLELRRELETRLGDGFDEKRYHDLLAENGNLPFYILKDIVSYEMVSAPPSAQTRARRKPDT
jgi:hypothetical protein